MPPIPTARAQSVALLGQVLGQGRLLSDAMSGSAWEAMPAPDRAAAQRMAQEVLRNLERCDRLLKPHLRKSPPLFVRNVLRLGAWELATGGAAHGVVNDCVQIVAGDRKTQSMKGLVNAVLRKLTEEAPAKWSTLRVPRLPRWLRDIPLKYLD